MPVSRTVNFESILSNISDMDVSPSPVHDGAKFINGALKASMGAHLKVRITVQNDIAHALNCNADALSFMWARPVRGAETLDCEIPDFREAFLESIPLKMAAE